MLFQQIPQDQTALLPQQQGYAPEKGYPTQEEYKSKKRKLVNLKYFPLTDGPPPYFFSQQQPYPTNTTAVPAAQQQPVSWTINFNNYLIQTL